MLPGLEVVLDGSGDAGVVGRHDLGAGVPVDLVAIVRLGIVTGGHHDASCVREEVVSETGKRNGNECEGTCAAEVSDTEGNERGGYKLL